MSDPTRRFSTRVDNYVKYRPGYPREVIDLLAAQCGLTPAAVVADVGSGTGILAELLLQHGNRVYGVEPNREMRQAAERLLKNYEAFASIDGKAEATTLETHSIDIITAGQAFHWFDQGRARVEFRRILKLGGWTALIWNERRLTSSDFHRDLEDLLFKFGTDYSRVRHECVYDDIAAFFGANSVKLATFYNFQQLDLEGLKGRICSASYAPEPGHPNFETLLENLLALFRTYEKSGTVTIEYDTKVYYGQMSN